MQEEIKHYLTVLQTRAFNLQNAFIHKFKQDWHLRESVCELVIQIGHLVHALNSENSNTFDFLQQAHRKRIENIGDELSDCMLSLLSISVYADISDTDIQEMSKVKMDQTLSPSDTTVALSILSAQLLDSYEIYCGLKPGFQPYERKTFLSMWYKIFVLVILIAKRKNISLEEQFSAMLNDAENFLKNTKD